MALVWGSEPWLPKGKGIKICYVPACPVSDGSSENVGNCMCGTSECTSSNGLFCRASVNKCGMVSPCTIVSRTVANDAACTCGSADCSVTNGLYCMLKFCTDYPMGSDALPNGEGTNNGESTGLRKVVSDFEQGSGDLYEVVMKTYGPIDSWDVSDVTNMESLFQSKYSFNADLSKWNVSRVTNMNSGTSLFLFFSFFFKDAINRSNFIFSQTFFQYLICATILILIYPNGTLVVSLPCVTVRATHCPPMNPIRFLGPSLKISFFCFFSFFFSKTQKKI